MTSHAPLAFRWEGDSFAPATPHMARLADEQFVVGETYLLERSEVRSMASHRQFFAALHECWQNLPETIAERFPTEDHLRRYALIKTGFRDERSIVCASKAEAQRVAAFIKPLDDYAVVVVQDAVVTHMTAKSQSTRAMGKKVFQQSKAAVLDYLASLIGVRPEELAKHAEAAE